MGNSHIIELEDRYWISCQIIIIKKCKEAKMLLQQIEYIQHIYNTHPKILAPHPKEKIKD